VEPRSTNFEITQNWGLLKLIKILFIFFVLCTIDFDKAIQCHLPCTNKTFVVFFKIQLPGSQRYFRCLILQANKSIGLNVPLYWHRYIELNSCLG